MALTKVKLIADGVITSANLDASHGITTSDIGEGSNLYYTDSRVSSYLSTNGFATQTDIVAAITDSAPVTLDTLNELAAALGDDPNFATTTATSLGLKAPLASPSFTGNVDVAGNITVGNNDSILAENNLRFKSSGAAYIDHNTVGQSFIFRTSNSSSLDTTALTIDSSGNVGIGVSPYSFAQLHIYDTSDIYIALQKGTANGYVINDGTNISLASDQGSTGKKLLVNRNAPDNSLIIDSSGNSIFVGDVNISNSSGATLNINTSLGAADSKILLHEGSTSSPANGASIRYDGVNNLFKIGVGTNVDTTRLTIARDTGNVGIGTTSMQGKLDVHNTGAASILYVSSDQGNNSTTSILNLGGASGRSASIQGYRAASSNEHELVFKTYSSGQYERMRITSGGEIQATPSASGRAFFSSQANANFSIAYTAWIANASTKVLDVLWYGSTIGSISVNASGTGINYNTSSDYRLKEDYQDFNGLDMVSNIPVYNFKWKSAEERSFGVKAHELQNILPQAVNGEKDAEEMQGVDYSKLTPILLKAIQELKADNDNLRERIQTLENQ